MRRRFVPALAVALLAASSSALAQPRPTQPKQAPPPAPTGTITGTVSIKEGKKTVNADAVVYVIGKAAPADVGPPQKHQIIQKDKKFWPDLIAITQGDAVAFPNQDKLLHNVFSPKPQFDLGTLKHGQGFKPTTFKNPGVVDVYCNIHPDMAATILVLPNRFHTKTRGKFTLSGVPAGEWTLFAYTRRAQKPRSIKVRVAAGQVTNVGTIQILRGPEPPHPNKYGSSYGPSYP